MANDAGGYGVGLDDGAFALCESGFVRDDRIFSEEGSKGSVDLASDSLFCSGARFFLLSDFRSGLPQKQNVPH